MIRPAEVIPQSAWSCSRATATALLPEMIWQTSRAKPAAKIPLRARPSLHRSHQQGEQAAGAPPVQGNAVRVATMLLHCDLVYLADNARLITPFVNLALVPEAASSWLLPLRIGHAHAYAMFALGEPMDAAAALACGLANAVVPQGELRKRANDAAVALSKRPAGSLRETKMLMRDHQRIAAQIAEEGQLFKERLKTAEAGQALAAFARTQAAQFRAAIRLTLVDA